MVCGPGDAKEVVGGGGWDEEEDGEKGEDAD